MLHKGLRRHERFMSSGQPLEDLEAQQKTGKKNRVVIACD